MQRALAIDGVEWAAADMTFLQTGIYNGIKNRTIIRTGTSGVFSGGVVANPSGFTITISGPLKFHANGELGIIASPANVTAAPSTTNYIIGVYQETQDTPATYYGGGGPPNIHANETPTVIVRGTAAVEANGEVNLATVVTNGSTSTSITDTRIILPSADGVGNMLLGPLKTIDGMDPSAHQVLVATSAVLGHVVLGAAGGATPYNTLRGTWKCESFIDVAATFAGTKILDDADFTSPPASSEPFNTTGLAFNTQYVPTRQGDLAVAGYGPRVAQRYTLNFTATGVVSVAIGLSNWDDGIRIKANGVSLFSTGTASNGAGQVFNFNTVVGANTIVVYLCNGGGNQFHVNVICDVLAQAGMIFTG